MLVFMGFVSCLRPTRGSGDKHESKSMDAMIAKSGEFLFRDLDIIPNYEKICYNKCSEEGKQ